MSSLHPDYSVFDAFPVLETDRLTLRSLDSSDKVALFNLRSDLEVMQYLDRAPMSSLSDAEAYISKAQEQFQLKQALDWAIVDKQSQQWIGYTGFWRIDFPNLRGEIGYTLDKAFWQCGYMSEALSATINFAFHALGLHSIVADVNPANEASIALLTKLGFKKEGHFRENYLYNGQFIDSAMFGLLKREWAI